jgi:lantibiotic modifying enzyme
MPQSHIGCFDEFFDPYLEVFVASIRRCELPDAAVAGLRASLMRTSLMPMACRVLIHEFRERYDVPSEPTDEPGTAMYRHFAEALSSEPVHREIVQRYPEMDRLLRFRVDTTSMLITSCLQRLRADRCTLIEAGLWPGAIETITLSDGDSHNGGQRVLLLHGSEGSLVYKPRPVDIDLFFEDVVERIRSWDVAVDLHAVHTVAGSDGSYGWQEFVTADEFPERGRVLAGFRATGQWLGLFHLLGATDLHHENVIADGRQLRFIDLETALGHITPDSFEGLRDHHTTLNQSVLGTMLLPGAMVNSVFDVSIAGLTTGETDESAQRTTFDVGGLGTDAISFQILPLTVTGTDSAVRSGGVVQVPMEYADEVEGGYRDMLDLLHRHVVALEALISRYASSAVRKVLRPTAIYARFLEASLQPPEVRA